MGAMQDRTAPAGASPRPTGNEYLPTKIVGPGVLDGPFIGCLPHLVNKCYKTGPTDW